MAGLINRNGRYYAEFNDSTRTPAAKRFSLWTSSKRTARQRLSKLEHDWDRVRFDPWTDDPRSYDQVVAVTLGHAVDRFIQSKRDQLRTENTIRTYDYVLGVFTEIVGRQTPLEQLSRVHIERFVQDSSRASATLKGRYARLRAFLNWCRKEEWLDQDPLAKVAAPRSGDRMPKAVSVDDLRRIESAIREDYAVKRREGGCRCGEIVWMIPMYWFTLYTGLRASELARLRWGHIDSEQRLIAIYKQKNGREQTIPLNTRASLILDDVPRGKVDDYVFRNPAFKESERSLESFRNQVSKTFTRYRKKAGIDRPITLHGLRHGFCTMLAEAGKSAVVIKEAARHADISTSMRYIHMANEHLKAELEDVFGDD